MDKLTRPELESLFEDMILNTIEAIIKHNNRAADMIRSGDFDKDDISAFHKKLLNLVHIIHSVKDVAREFITKEHPEYVYILDYAEKVYTELEGDK